MALIKNILKPSFKTFFSPKKWLGADSIQDSTRLLTNSLKQVFTTNIITESSSETFNQVIDRLRLTPEFVKDLSEGYQLLSYVFLIIGLSLFIVGGWLFFKVYLSGSIISFSVGVCSLAQAFKYNFWHFQIKHQKLGCSFFEWREGKIKS
jgi:intracellular multiplication protein IcmV